MLKTCQFCGKVYKTYHSNSMFCSFVQIKKINIIEKILKVLR